MAQNNAINNKTTQLTIDPGAYGDSFVQFAINTTDEFRMGVDDDASDAFVISQGGALGSSNTYVITADGEVTQPLNPAFFGYLATDELNVTGNSTFHTVGTTTAFTEVFDQGSDFNTNGTFTAPITGRYYLSAVLSLLTPSGGGKQVLLRISTSNRTYNLCAWPMLDRVTTFYGNNQALGITIDCVADMDAADTATIVVLADGGAKTCDVDGSGS